MKIPPEWQQNASSNSEYEGIPALYRIYMGGSNRNCCGRYTKLPTEHVEYYWLHPWLSVCVCDHPSCCSIHTTNSGDFFWSTKSLHSTWTLGWFWSSADSWRTICCSQYIQVVTLPQQGSYSAFSFVTETAVFITLCFYCFSALKLVYLFSINPHLGPLQISLGRMVIDIVKFFFIYSLVLFSFSCGKMVS